MGVLVSKRAFPACNRYTLYRLLFVDASATHVGPDYVAVDVLGVTLQQRALEQPHHLTYLLPPLSNRNSEMVFFTNVERVQVVIRREL